MEAMADSHMEALSDSLNHIEALADSLNHLEAMADSHMEALPVCITR